MLSSTKTTAERPPAEATLLRRYARIYAISRAVLLALSLAGIAIAMYAGLGAGLAVTVPASGLLAGAVLLRWHELRVHRGGPGPRPTFFLGNMKDLLAHGHRPGGRVPTSRCGS